LLSTWYCQAKAFSGRPRRGASGKGLRPFPKIVVKSYSVHRGSACSAPGAFVSADSRSCSVTTARRPPTLMPVIFRSVSPGRLLSSFEGEREPCSPDIHRCVRDVSQPLAIQNWGAAATRGEVVGHHSPVNHGPMTRADPSSNPLMRPKCSFRRLGFLGRRGGTTRLP